METTINPAEWTEISEADARRNFPMCGDDNEIAVFIGTTPAGPWWQTDHGPKILTHASLFGVTLDYSAEEMVHFYKRNDMNKRTTCLVIINDELPFEDLGKYPLID